MNPLIPAYLIVLLAIGVLTGTGLVAWYTTRRSGTLLRVAITGLRIVAVAGVLALLLNIGEYSETIREEKSSWAIMLDNSTSMAYADDDLHNRWETAKKVVSDAIGLARKKAMPSLYVFSDSVSAVPVAEIDTWLPNGDDSQIVASGRQVMSLEKSRGAHLQGILLLSDGRQPIQQPPEALGLFAAARGIPIFPIIHGGEVPFKDLEVHLPRSRHVGFAGQPITISGHLVNNRLGAIQTELSLSEVGQSDSQTKSYLVQETRAVPFNFEITKKTPGYYEYVIRTPSRQGEADRANNSRGLGVFVLADRLKVLLLEGEPYWDTKFLSHFLRAQSNIEMTAVFRVTKERFFKVSSDTAMSASNDDAFPRTFEEISQYDLVLLGRGAEYFIDENRAGLLTRFVKDHGGCLFFARGKSYTGPQSHLQNLEPVSWGRSIRANFGMRPLLGGEQVGLFGGLLPERKDALWQDLPHLSRAHECSQLLGFAMVLADGVPDVSRQSSFPLLVSKRFGRGIVLLINGDGLWKWGFYPEVTDQLDVYQNLWLRLFQWAVSYAEFNPGSHYLIQAERTSARVGEPFRVRVNARAHAELANLVVHVYRDMESVKVVSLGESTDRNASWSGLITLDTPGVYRLNAETPDGRDLGAQTTIQVLPPPGETDNISADVSFLEAVAAQSGGRVLGPNELAGIIAGFETETRSLQKGDKVWRITWDKIWVMLLLMLCFSLEWYWRRRQGLP